MDSPSARSSVIAALLLVLAGAASATEAPKDKTPPPIANEPEQQELQELDEALVHGEKPVKDDQLVINWLASLAGEFTFEGNGQRKYRRSPEKKLRGAHLKLSAPRSNNPGHAMPETGSRSGTR